MQTEWGQFLCAMTLTLMRISGIVLFAPFFSSTALPVRTKAVLVLATTYLLAPLVARLPGTHTAITYTALIGELAIGLVYGLLSPCSPRCSCLPGKSLDCSSASLL